MESDEFSMLLGIQYLGQLNDLEVNCESDTLNGIDGLKKVLRNFEDEYGRVYSLSAKSPELGYLITKVVITGRVQVEKPVLPEKKMSGKKPAAGAKKHEREIYFRHRWIKADIYEMDRINPGNLISGPAVIEAPSTTLVIPPGRKVELDEHLIFHMNTITAKEKSK